MRLFEFTYEMQTGPFNRIIQLSAFDWPDIAKKLWTRAPMTVELFLETFTVYRALRAGAFDYGEFKSVAGRTPTSSSERLQINIDTCLEVEQFQALRSNSAFCTGSQELASNFGRVFMMFPFEPFDFTWSTAFEDLYNDITSKDEAELERKLEGSITGAAKWFVQTYGFRSDNFPAAVASKHEILVKGEYALISTSQRWNLLEALQSYKPGK